MTTTEDPLLPAFLAAKRLAGMAPATLRTYRYHLTHFLAWRAGRPLDRTLIRAYMAHLSATKANPITVNNYLRDVSALCTWLVEDGELEINPAQRLRIKLPKRRPASYGRDHIRALLAAAGPRDRALVITLLDTGLRASELIQLKRTSIDPRSGYFQIIGKGNKQRAGWVSAYALKAIRAYLATRDDAEPALFINQRGGPLSAKGIHHAVDVLARKAGIRDEVRRLVHSFRATFAKNWRKGGGDLGSLAELLGHSTLAMAQYYSQLADDELGELKRKVNPLAVDIEEAA